MNLGSPNATHADAFSIGQSCKAAGNGIKGSRDGVRRGRG